MGTPCYVGTASPHQPHLIHARYVHFDGYPSSLLARLRGIWAGVARRDTNALTGAVLAHDWEYLDPAVTATTPCGPGGIPTQRPVAGVGMTLGTGEPGGFEPVTVFPLSLATDLGAAWIYVIDPASGTVAVYTGDGEPAAIHPLAPIPIATHPLQPLARNGFSPTTANTSSRRTPTPGQSDARRPRPCRPAAGRCRRTR
ncbi:hypothetical protein [Polymorphospora rubra]|uniref:Uncharacterized protein n=1 Tax=Polymorphospora rubra TaxID=338584 RepID=A0A810N1M5_9ACTN|nr:hypothetical protein [Polymorphospora rubra]BCJ65663.1 hypothetical protein Prubr_26840 [Polymorphospora rubra]